MFGKKPAAPKPSTPSSAPPPLSEDDDEFITLYDEYGRELQVSKSEWITHVLPANLEKNWRDADGLASTIIMSLDDGFAPALLDASAQLLKIDDIKERSHVLRGIVLMKTGAFKDAEKILNTGIKICGPTGYLLTNLAKVQFEQGNKDKSLDTLWSALKSDPNQDNGLMWWAALHNDKGGEGEYLNALRRVTMIEGSWRAQLWLARHALENNDLARAEELYVYVLQFPDLPPDVFQMISGDLGHNGHVEAIIDILEPIYDPELHGLAAGTNLLKAYLELGRKREGKVFLDRLFALNRPDARAILNDFAQAFDNLDSAPRPTPKQEQRDGTAQITPYMVDKPIWYYGLADPQWIVPPRKNNAETVSFFVLATVADEGKAPQTEKTDERGRLSRGIPLFLAESLLLNGHHRAQAVIPVMPGQGAVLSSGPWPLDHVYRFTKGSDIVVTGMLKPEGEAYRVTLDILDGKSRNVLHTISGKLARETAGDDLQNLERAMLSFFEADGAYPGAPYARPPAAHTRDYVYGLEQSLALSLAVNKVFPAESLYGERAMLDWFLNLALNSPETPQNAMMFLSGLCKNRQYGSSVYKEYEGKVFKLLEDAPEHSPFCLMAPVLHMLYDRDDDALAAIGVLAKIQFLPDNRRQWLENLL